MTEGKLFSGKTYSRELKKVEQYLDNAMMKVNIKCEASIIRLEDNLTPRAETT
jgi:hypothetical protein